MRSLTMKSLTWSRRGRWLTDAHAANPKLTAQYNDMHEVHIGPYPMTCPFLFMKTEIDVNMYISSTAKKYHYTSPDQVEPKRWRKRTWQRKNGWLLILEELNYRCERDSIGIYHKYYECVYQYCFHIEECWKSILWWCTCVFWNAAIIFFLNLCYANCVYCSCLLLNRWYIIFMPNTCFFLFQFFLLSLSTSKK